MTFRDRVLDDDVYSLSMSLSEEEVRRIMRGLMEAQLDIIKFSMNPPRVYQAVEKEGSD